MLVAVIELITEKIELIFEVGACDYVLGYSVFSGFDFTAVPHPGYYFNIHLILINCIIYFFHTATGSPSE